MRDITALLPISRELAIEYTLTGLSAHELCAKNCLAAKKVGRKDLVPAHLFLRVVRWSLVVCA
jgi:hypothetical protein